MITRLRDDASTASIPIVVLSAEADISRLPVDAVIAKPFTNGNLTAVVRSLLERVG
jgi:CheY-like chemotaxis protein